MSFWDKKNVEPSVLEAYEVRLTSLETTAMHLSTRISEINGILARMNARLTTAQREAGDDDVKRLKQQIRDMKELLKSDYTDITDEEETPGLYAQMPQKEVEGDE